MNNVHPIIQKFREKFKLPLVESYDQHKREFDARPYIESFLLEVDKQAREEERKNALDIAKMENRKHLEGRNHCLCFEKTLRKLSDLQHQERKEENEV